MNKSLPSSNLFRAVLLFFTLVSLSPAAASKNRISKRDSSFLVKNALRYELKGEGASDPNVLLYFSNNGVGPWILKGLASNRLRVLTAAEIKGKISSQESFTYLQLVRLSMKGQRARVILIENEYLKGKLNDYEVVTHYYRRRSGRWVRTGAEGYSAPRAQL